MDNVQKVEDLLNLSTEGLICLAALELFDMQSLKSTPREAPSNRSNEECKIFLQYVMLPLRFSPTYSAFKPRYSIVPSYSD